MTQPDTHKSASDLLADPSQMELDKGEDVTDVEGGEKYKAADTDFDPVGDDESEEETATSIVHTPVTLEWKNLTYTVNPRKKLFCASKDKSEGKKILHGISGAVEPGQMLAIMGASGAGKTTFLNLLAGRLSSARNVTTGGQILVNGEKRQVGAFKKLAAYVEQDDNMFAELTVEEQIVFSANLRLPKTYSSKQRKAKADSVITELSLGKCKNSFIGDDLKRGVSGGERKRVNIGTELVTDPSLIFLDEPTSGLDSFNALNVMHTLRHLSQRGRTVVSTIHQPRSNIFSLFDRLLLLSNGQVMYFGPAAGATTYFAALQFPCPANFNPADFVIDLVSYDPRTPEKEKSSTARIEMLEKAYKAYEEKQEIESFLLNPVDRPDTKVTKYNTSWFPELFYVMGRQVKKELRSTELNVTAVATCLIFAILLGLIWLNIGREFFEDVNSPSSEEKYRALIGVVFFATINQAFASTFTAIFAFPSERSVVLRERSSHTYRVSTYFIAKTIVELPHLIVPGILFSVITYWMIGFKADARAFFIYLIIIVLTQWIAESLSIMIAVVAKDAQLASSIIPVVLILSLLFSGFLINEEDIPGFLRWIQYTSFIKYGLTVVTQTQFEGAGRYEELIKTQFGNVSLATSYIVMVALGIFYRLATYVFLRLNGPKFDRSI